MRNVLAMLAATVAAGCVVAGCGELAVYEAPDAVTVHDGHVGDSAADSRANDGGGDDGSDAADVQADAVTVADTSTDSAPDVAPDVQPDVQEDVQPDTATCAEGTVACTVGGPCEGIGTTDQLCGACPGMACGAGFSCIHPSPSVFDRECCRPMQGCSDCPSPAGCLTTPEGISYCCENN